MKKPICFIAALAASLLCYIQPVAAAQITPQPPTSASTPNVIVTSIVAGGQLEQLEIFNQADIPINLSNVRVAFTAKGIDTCLTPQTATMPIASQWILPKHYLTLSKSQSPPTGCTKLTHVHIMDGNATLQQITFADNTTPTTDKVYQHKQRANSPTSARTVSGSFETDYTKIVATNQATLYSDPLYSPPQHNNGLQILEVLINAQSCSPTAIAATCSDFIKVYNPTDQPIDLAKYQLRVGRKGQSASITNSFSWGRVLDPTVDELLLPARSYFTLLMRNDGQPLSITDSGGYIWLEDAYGIKIYEPIIEYPDASSTTKVGKSWAFNGSNWQWSAAPQPDRPNYFPPDIAVSSSSAAVESSLKSCAADQYRSLQTNRCRNLASATSTATPCKEGQQRNPDTHRCRNILASDSEPKPCNANEERNPETNRCRKKPASTSGHIKGTSDTNATANQYTWVIAVAAAIAIGYVAYEWRQDIAQGFTRFKNAVASRLKR